MQCNDGCTNYKQEYWEYRQEYWEYWSTDRNTGVQTGILEYRQEYWSTDRNTGSTLGIQEYEENISGIREYWGILGISYKKKLSC